MSTQHLLQLAKQRHKEATERIAFLDMLLWATPEDQGIQSERAAYERVRDSLHKAIERQEPAQGGVMRFLKKLFAR